MRETLTNNVAIALLQAWKTPSGQRNTTLINVLDRLPGNAVSEFFTKSVPHQNIILETAQRRASKGLREESQKNT